MVMNHSQPVPDDFETGPSPAGFQRSATWSGHSKLHIEDDGWKDLNLLSFDGGGVRGYWSLLVLEKLMKFIGELEEKYRADNQGEKERSVHQNNFEDVDEEDNVPDLGMAESTRSLMRRWPRAEDDMEGLHSFWPEACPQNVSQVNNTKDEEEKMENIRKRNNDPRELFGAVSGARRYLPCHYFDFICGSSTGALIAIMLGRFRMTVADCLQEYEQLAKNIFSKSRVINQRRMAIGRPKYYAENAKAVFEDVVARRCELRDIHSGPVTLPTPPGMCKVFVTALRTYGRQVIKPQLYRSYRLVEKRGIREDLDNNDVENPTDGKSKRRSRTGMSSQDERKPNQNANDRKVDYGEADVVKIWQIARGATAARLYFEPLKMKVSPPQKDPRHKYAELQDGGLKMNNPTEEGVCEIQELHGKHSVGTVVSIGTSRREGDEKDTTSLLGLVRESIQALSDPEPVHRAVSKESKDFSNGFEYYRFNNTTNPLDLELDDWRAAKSGHTPFVSMKHNFLEYLEKSTDELKTCARSLVSRRRVRAKDRAKWERFALGSRFYCPEINCEREFSNRDDFLNHLCTHPHLRSRKGDIQKMAENDLTSHGRMHTWEYQRSH